MKYKLVSLFMASILVMRSGLNAFASVTKIPFSTSIGVDFARDGVDTRNDATNFARSMKSIGLDSLLRTQLTYDDWTEKWKNVDGSTVTNSDGRFLLEGNVLMLAGHGSFEGIFFNQQQYGGNYATGVCTGQSREITFSNTPHKMIGLEDIYWGETLLAVFCACNTANSGSFSLARRVAMAGSNVSLGWNDTIQDGDAEKWITRFGEYLAKDYAILDAMNKASSFDDYENSSTIKDIGGWVFSGKYWNVILSDYFNSSSRSAVVIENDDDIIVPEYDVAYSFKNKDTTEISDYIKENLDQSFNIEKFEVNEFDSLITDGDTLYGVVSLSLKAGDFVTENGYYISTINDKVDKIFVTGKPSCSTIFDMPRFASADEEQLKNDALEDLTLGETEKVFEQTVLKKYDSEPYYVVITKIKDSESNVTRGVSYEYRP